MSEIGIFEAKTKLSEICTQVKEAGAEYIITRRGRPIARITGIVTKRDESTSILTRMAETEREHGKISEDEGDFPEVWLNRRSQRTDPFSDEAQLPG